MIFKSPPSNNTKCTPPLTTRHRPSSLLITPPTASNTSLEPQAPLHPCGRHAHTCRHWQSWRWSVSHHVLRPAATGSRSTQGWEPSDRIKRRNSPREVPVSYPPGTQEMESRGSPHTAALSQSRDLIGRCADRELSLSRPAKHNVTETLASKTRARTASCGFYANVCYESFRVPHPVRDNLEKTTGNRVVGRDRVFSKNSRTSEQHHDTPTAARLSPKAGELRCCAHQSRVPCTRTRYRHV